MSLTITRFAPSPTGCLHIGGARTALFNWLYAKHTQGKFFLRIEDTDKKRSTKQAINAIIRGLEWLGITHDGEIIFQSQKIDRHIEVINKLLQNGHAYYCSCTEEDIKKIQGSKQDKKQGCVCRNKPQNFNSSKKNKVVRFKVPEYKESSPSITFIDAVYGQITVDKRQIEDMIILRSDNTPTYNLAVVVDDHDIQVSHIIRGTDHLTNTTKQILIYQALGWNTPQFSHIPLIHDHLGNKLSKRHGATSVSDYASMGILPEAMCNYLLRMGWSCKNKENNKEIININQAIDLFSIKNIGTSPARLDNKKLEHFNNHYINIANNNRIFEMIIPIIEKKLKCSLKEKSKSNIIKGLTDLKKRVTNLIDLAESSLFYVEELPVTINQEAQQIISSSSDTIAKLFTCLSDIDNKNWSKDIILNKIKELSKNCNIKMNDIYHSLRSSITGKMNAPSIIDIMVILEKDECLKRIKRVKSK